MRLAGYLRGILVAVVLEWCDGLRYIFIVAGPADPCEKKAAHVAFEAALSRERAAIRRDIEAMLRDPDDQAEIWAIRDFLNGKARELDQKYDFRYSVLIGVFAQLMAEGWLTLEDLAGMDLAKRELIREHSTAWWRADD
ncbi:hypothetical protein [Candidatus Nitrotoga sp. 1052]|uniref:hypothetical protein n=1 Tax=Candidatus Nitrotoga sp. 1052 TaxID=2886964 RepID=UPI001EF5FE4A|nr:hypothetical protein [Candidatus Nitrotoga sp. 1052]